MSVSTTKPSLKKDTALVYLGYALRLLSPLILIPYYGRVLGPAGYGQILAATSFAAIITVIINYGFYFPAIRDMSAAATRAARSAIFSRQIFARLAMIPAALIIGIAGIYSSQALSSGFSFGGLTLLIGIVNAMSPGWIFQGLRQFKIMIGIEALSYPINIGLILLMVRGPQDSFKILIALLISGCICCALAFILALREADLHRVSPRQCWQEVKNSTVFFYTSMSFTIITSGSTYILSLMASAAEVGYFGPAERIVSLGFNLLTPIGQVLLPRISSLHAGSPHEAGGLAKKGVLFEACYGLLGLALGLPLAPLVMPLILGAKFAPTVPVLQIMLIMFPFIALKHALSLYLLIPQKKEKLFLITTTINIITNLGVAIWATPLWGAVGMAAARASGEIVTTFILVILMMRLGLFAKPAIAQRDTDMEMEYENVTSA